VVIYDEVSGSGEQLQGLEIFDRNGFVKGFIDEKPYLATSGLKESLHPACVVADCVVFGDGRKDDCDLHRVLCSVIKY
jgi:hypothetical protein